MRSGSRTATDDASGMDELDTVRMVARRGSVRDLEISRTGRGPSTCRRSALEPPGKSRGQLIDIVVEPDAVMLPMIELMIGVNADHE